ncbi:MAG TPA: Tic22 family protein [Allocoleopsis sp.]
MKSLMRFTATVALISTTIIGTTLLGNSSTLAIPQEQIIKKLQPIPVFAITDAQGTFLVASVNEGQKKSAVTGVFLSKKDAEAFVERLKKENPTLAKTVKIVPTPLAEIYKLQEQNKNKPDALIFAFVPTDKQTQSALTLIRKTEPTATKFLGVPLFAAKAGKNKGYLTIEKGNQKIIPFFFDREQLQTLVDNFKKQQPKEAQNIEIQVVPLEGMLGYLQTKNEPELNNIVIFPSMEGIEFLRTLQSQSNPPKNPK